MDMVNEQLLHIGIDDTDSLKGMCTTYIGARLGSELAKFSTIVSLKLIRLNPNIEWKTRGNASISLSINTKNKEKAKKTTLAIVKKYSELGEENTNPGVVFLEGAIPRAFTDFYHRTLHGVVSIADAEATARRYGAEIHKFKKGRGIIGALAAIGSKLEDHTHEIIVYRMEKNYGRPRKVDKTSVYEMDARTFPITFNNVDYASSRILITPHSPCPVLFGIRGENPGILTQALDMIKANEPMQRVALFETNQATDAHLEHAGKISEIKPYSSVILEGRVIKRPKIISGGHVIFSITDGEDRIDCAAYEPTKNFRWVVNKLRAGDSVRVFGGVRAGERLTINLEKLEIVKLEKIYKEKNPVCEKCGKHMKSAGKNQGFRCKRCKTHKDKKIRVEVKRDVEEKLYEVPPAAMRHLSKPLVRFHNL
jgi:tRNA(Ile2)-agmatinylcytidine synthase